MKNFSLNGYTKFVLLFGKHIELSPSPALHTNWFRALKQNSIYLPFQIQEDSQFKTALSAMLPCSNFLGANITMPFKHVMAALPYYEKSQRVLDTGVANTLFNLNKSSWALDNTDVYGVQKCLSELNPNQIPYHLIVIGNGATSVSAIYAGHILDKLCQSVLCLGEKKEIFLKRYPNIRKFKKLNCYQINDFVNLAYPCHDNIIVINTSSEINFEKKSWPEINTILDFFINKWQSKRLSFIDVNYLESENIKFANAHNIPNLNGETLLIEQARHSFKLWTGFFPE